MPNITGFAHPEQANGAGGVYANNLTQFGHEVMARFKDQTLVSGLITRDVAIGTKSKQYDLIGETSADYHSVGTEILGNDISANKIAVNVDDRPLIAHTFMDEAEQILAHYDARKEYADELVRALVDEVEKRALQVLALASDPAASPAPITGGRTGNKIVAAGSATTMSTLVTALYTARTHFAVNNVDLSEVYLALSPATFYLLAQENQVIDGDLNSGDNGGINVGEFMRVAGFTVIKTNHMPSGVVASKASDGNTYDGDFSDLVGVLWHRSAAQTLVAMDVKTGTDGYEERRQGTLLVAKTLQGTGVKRRECAVSIYNA